MHTTHNPTQVAAQAARTDFDLQSYIAMVCRIIISIPPIHAITWITTHVSILARDGRLSWRG